MNKYEDVYLSRTDVLDLQKRLIGKGTDGCVYDVGHGYLYKIYHDESFFSDIKVRHPFLDGFEDDDIKIAQKGMYSSIKEFYPHFKYVDTNGVRIGGEEAIYLAIEKQKYIKKTQLPLAPIFVNSRFKGCVLKKHSYHCQLHSLTFLPGRYKAKIMLSILDSIEELLDNNIYHLDVSNYPDDKSKTTHSNILVSMLGVPQLIDVDGKSTFFLEHNSDTLLSHCLTGLNFLFLQFYYDLDVPDEMLDDDFWMFGQELEKRNVPDEYIDSLLYRECDISGMRKILKR